MQVSGWMLNRYLYVCTLLRYQQAATESGTTLNQTVLANLQQVFFLYKQFCIFLNYYTILDFSSNIEAEADRVPEL